MGSDRSLWGEYLHPFRTTAASTALLRGPPRPLDP